MTDESKKLSVKSTPSQAGKKGGARCAELYGREYYQEIGRKGGAALMAKRGVEFFRSIAVKGGASTRAKYGTDHYQAIGKKGGNRMKALVEAGKRAEMADAKFVLNPQKEPK